MLAEEEKPEDEPKESEENSEEGEEPSSLEISAPAKGDPIDDPWTIEATNQRVLKGWQQLLQDTPANAVNCYDWLRRHPTQRLPKRCFPLKYKHNGHWCYEIGSGDRVYYKPDEAEKIVTVWYAGSHPKDGIPPAPKDL